VLEIILSDVSDVLSQRLGVLLLIISVFLNNYQFTCLWIFVLHSGLDISIKHYRFKFNLRR